MKAKDKRGFEVPWVYVRHVLAQKWRLRPWEVDEAPWDEVLTALDLFGMEAEAAERNQ